MTYEEAKIQIQAIPEKIWDQLSEPDREAMDMAFKALEENYPLKQRCFVLSNGLLCHFCKMECNHRGD